MDWSSSVVPAVRALRPYQAGVTEQQLRRDSGLRRIAKFASNEAAFGPSPAVAAAMAAALTQAHRYPDAQELKARLAAHLGVPAACLRLGNGSTDVIASLLRLLVDERHNVVLSRYGYSAYAPLVAAQRGAVRWAESDPQFGHQVEALLAQVDADTRVMLLDSPSNLAGQWLDAAQLRRLIDGLPGHVTLVLDEAYVEFVDVAGAAATAQLPLRHPRLVVTRTFSKAYGLAGMRIGYAIADAGLVDYLDRAGLPFPVGGAALAGACAALDDQAHVARIVAAARRGRRRLATALSGLGIPLCQGQGNFVLADFGAAAQPVYRDALAQGLILRPMAAYGLGGHLRISSASAPDNALLAARLPALWARHAEAGQVAPALAPGRRAGASSATRAVNAARAVSASNANKASNAANAANPSNASDASNAAPAAMPIHPSGAAS